MKHWGCYHILEHLEEIFHYLSFLKGHPKGTEKAFNIGNNASIHNRASRRSSILLRKHSKEIVQSIHITEPSISLQLSPQGKTTTNYKDLPLSGTPAQTSNLTEIQKDPTAQREGI